MDYTAATMSTLRIRLASPSDPDAPSPWWRTDSAGRVSDRGVGAPTAWPPADRTELMLGADTGMVRLPLAPVSAATVARVRELLRGVGLEPAAQPAGGPLAGAAR